VGGGAALVAARAGSSLAAPAPKVAICHWSEDLGYYELISVSANAVPAHRAHQHGMDIVPADLTSTNTCGDCNTVCEPVDACTPAACNGGVCNSTSNCGDGQVCGANGCETVSSCPHIEREEPVCFWQNCFGYGGECCWDLNGFSADSQAACQGLDSCSPGGGNGSGGGCYKWALSSDTVIAPPW
jgi:hypothetical protein